MCLRACVWVCECKCVLPFLWVCALVSVGANFGLGVCCAFACFCVFVCMCT